MGIAGWIIPGGRRTCCLLYVVGVYNRLVRLRALVEEGFSGITVQLRRRADLIPNLVEAVKGYATHERETLDAGHRPPRGRDQSAERGGYRPGRRPDDRACSAG